jgi:hypothetical protein
MSGVAGITPEVSATLRRLLDEGARFDIHYPPGYANHRPMALHALARLGAPAARLEQWARAYEKKLVAAPPIAEWPAGDAWFAHLGQHGSWPMHRALFARWLDEEPAGDVLQQVLPRLLQGVGGGAFHGLIRSAHAVAAAHRAELADALAYWATAWLPLGRALANMTADVDDPERLLHQQPRAGVGKGMLVAGMRDAAADRGFSERAAHLRLDGHTLARLARLAAMAFAASNNFALLHLVTSSLALQALLPFVDDDTPRHEALAAYWRAYLATVASAGIQRLPPLPDKSWKTLVAKAIAHDDDHVIKLVDACVQHAGRDPQGPWRAAATRAVGTG